MADRSNVIYDTIYLSPHLDDVALSCGGQVYLQSEDGKPVLIVTVMAGDPPQGAATEFVQALHDRWELQRHVVASRRAEDVRAARILGADHQFWGIPDCIYRTNKKTDEALYNSNEDIFADVHAMDSVLVDTIARWVNDLPPHRRLVVPLGVGNHVDHQITRQAAERAHPGELLYYEDYPYLVAPGAVEAIVQVGGGSWRSTTIPLSVAALRAKIEAIAAYRSQMSTFFQGRTDLEDAVREHNDLRGGERLWRR